MNKDLLRWAVALVSAYVLALGGTFGGMIHPIPRFITLGLLVVLFGVWWVTQRHHNSENYVTPLGRLVWLWALVLGLSLWANWESSRRILMGIWYASLYLALWYLLHDALARHLIQRETMIDGFLLSGAGILTLGLVQVIWSLLSEGALSPVMGVFGNQNFMGAYLVMLLFLAIGRWGTLDKDRWRLELYVLVTALLLVLTGSRGALSGGVAALLVLGALGLHSHGMLSRQALQTWWQSLSPVRRRWVRWAFIGMSLSGIGMMGLLIYSLTLPGRGAGLRTYLWDAALALFAESPLLGKGLFTFGQHLPRFTAIPGTSPHSHAHNLILQIAAELGFAGVILLVVSSGLVIRLISQQWQGSKGPQRWLLAGVIGALVTVVVHQQVDVPVMMPAIAVMALVVLVLATAPVFPQPLAYQYKAVRRFRFAQVALWGSLIISGLWSTTVYQQYWSVLHDAIDTGEYYEAAQQLQPVIEAEPNLSLYQGQQAYLLGLAAAETEDEAIITEAIEAYESVVELEPYYAPYQANLAALYWQLGEAEQGIDRLLRAIWLAPSTRPLWQQLGVFVSEMIDVELVESNPDDPLELDDLSSDFRRAESIAHGQFLRDAIGRQFLPQVAFPMEG
jgi:O-antigen ligase